MKKRKPVKLPHLKLVKGLYYLRPYIPVKQRGIIETDKYGYAKTIYIGKETDSDAKIRAAYTAAEKQLEQEKAPERLTLKWLSQEYQKSRAFKQLEPSTQKHYTSTGAAILKHIIKVNGEEEPLEKMDVRDLETPTIRSILDKRYQEKQDRGVSGASQCNQELIYLSLIYKHGMQYFSELASLPRNPASGIEKYKIDARERYVTDREYQQQYDIACTMTGHRYLPIFMELTYLLAARGIEVTDLTVDRLVTLEEGQKGIYVKRRKGSKDTTIIASPRLLAAWDAAISLHKITPIGTTPLLIGRGGHPVTRYATYKAWNKLKTKMEESGLGEVYFITHDLKRKGISDAEDDKIAGHKSDHIRANYNVKHRTYKAPK